MSNCVVRSRGPRLPCSIVADHGIEGSDHLSHDGDDNDFGFLVGRGETVVEDFKDGDGVNQPPSTLTMLLSRHTRRRELITLVGGAAVWPLLVHAQHRAGP